MTAVALRVERLGDAEYVCAGRGRAMGLAHGASGDVDANFSPLLDALGDRWSFVGSRYPGTGGSGPLDDLPSVLRPEVLADRLVEALDAEGHQRVPVAGVSFGCSVAIQAALRHPDRVSALVLTVGFARPDVQLRQMLGTWEQLAGGPPERLGAFSPPRRASSRPASRGRSCWSTRRRATRSRPRRVSSGRATSRRSCRGWTIDRLRCDLVHVRRRAHVSGPIVATSLCRQGNVHETSGGRG